MTKNSFTLPVLASILKPIKFYEHASNGSTEIRK